MVTKPQPWTARAPNENLAQPRLLRARLSSLGQREAQMRGLGRIRDWSFAVPLEAQQEGKLPAALSRAGSSELAIWSLMGKLHFTLDVPVMTRQEVLEALIEFEHFRAEVAGANISLAMLAAAVGALCWH